MKNFTTKVLAAINMKKTIMVVIALLWVMPICGCGYAETADITDFAVTMEYAEDDIVFGEPISVLVRFTNLTDKKYKIAHSGSQDKNSILNIVFVKDGEDEEISSIQNKVTGHQIKAKEAIRKTFILTPQEEGLYDMYAYASFSIGDEHFIIKSDISKIEVKKVI